MVNATRLSDSIPEHVNIDDRNLLLIETDTSSIISPDAKWAIELRPRTLEVGTL